MMLELIAIGAFIGSGISRMNLGIDLVFIHLHFLICLARIAKLVCLCIIPDLCC